MAKKNNLIIEIDGDSKKLEKAARNSEKEVKEAARDMKNDIKDVGYEVKRTSSKAEGAISKVADKAKTAGKVIGAGFVAAGAAAGTAAAMAFNVGKSFESAFAGVKKTVEATDEQLADLEQGIRDLAMEMPTTADEIAGVAEAAGQLGIKTDNILEFSKTMVMLGDSTNLSANEAATSLARLANIMKTPQDSFDEMGSTIVALGNNLATTEAEIVEMSMRLAGAGKQVGLTEAQVLSFAGALSSVGIEAEAGGTAFSKVFSEMSLAAQKGGKDLQSFASVAGMTASEFANKFNADAAGAINEFIKGLGRIQAEGGSAIAILDEMGITEIRMRDALLRASGASEVFENALKIGSDAWSDNNALVNEATQRYKTVDSQLAILKNKFIDLGISIYKSNNEAISGSLALLSNYTSQLNEAFESEGFSGVLEQSGNIIGDMAVKIAENLPQLIEVAQQMINAFLNAINENVHIIGTAATDIITIMVDTLLANIPQFIQTALTLILTLAQGITQALPNLIPSVVDTMLTIIDTLLNNIDMIADTAIDLIIALAEGLIKALPKLLEKAPEIIIKLSDAIVRNAPKLFNASLQLIITLGEGLIKAIPTLIKNIPTIITAIVNSFTIGTRIMREIGKNIVEGLWNGIINTKDWLLNKIKSFATTITQGIKDFFGIHSPSRVMRDEVGKMIALGLAEGIEDNRSEVEKVMDEMNKSLLDSEILYNNESERLKNSKSESDKKYLEKLKDNAEVERKIYDARQKDLKNAQNEIVEQYKKMAEEVFDSIEEVEKAQKNMAKKLTDYGGLYKKKEREVGIEYTFDEKKGVLTGKRQLEEVYELEDLSKQTEDLKKFSKNLMFLKDNKEIPKEFFEVMRDMGVDEGIKFTNALLELSDSDFNDYIAKWKEKQTAGNDISKVLYQDEANAAMEGAIIKLSEFNEKFEEGGEENAKSWGAGFIEKMREIMPDVMDKIKQAFSEIVISASANVLLAGGGNTYNSTVYLRPSSGESTREQLTAVKNAQTYEKMRGGY